MPAWSTLEAEATPNSVLLASTQPCSAELRVLPPTTGGSTPHPASLALVAAGRDLSQGTKESEANPVSNHGHIRQNFELVVFDLDNTLARTEDLDSFRGLANLGPRDADYGERLCNALAIPGKYGPRPLVPEKVLVRIQAESQITVFTRAPRRYAETLLATLYPGIRWNGLVAYEDVTRTKPDPEGMRMLMAKAGVMDPERVVLVGDERSDLICAYRAGVKAALFRSAWPSSLARPQWQALEAMSDGDLRNQEDLVQFLHTPKTFLPPLERPGDPQLIPTSRKSSLYKNYFPPEELKGRLTSAWVLALGRYFTADLARAKSHPFTQQFLAFKHDRGFPKEWLGQLALAGFTLLGGRQQDEGRPLLTVIPRKPGRPERLELLLRPLKEIISSFGMEVDTGADVFEFKAGAADAAQDHLSSAARFHGLLSSLHCNRPELVRARPILLIDDTITSGASFLVAGSLLREAGAGSVHNLSLARSITSYVRDNSGS